MTAPDRLYFTGDDEADALNARDPLALLIGFALDQQVTVPTAFLGPLKLQQRLGHLDAGRIAAMDPAELEAAFRERPAVHRFPGAMAKRVQALCAAIAEDYDGDAAAVWLTASDTKELERRIRKLPGFGDMKVIALGATLSKRFDVAVADGLVPGFPTLGDVDSVAALEEYQAAKRAHKAALRARQAEPA
ncbi:MAG TPA: HhH-GPD-type base excision DNA repair protein [Gaiella sp.]|nr:HhH-GPD-type base excision DNA repair protein [Gaiella sp.]